MKIRDDRVDTTFGMLDIGDVFNSGNYIYLKTEVFYSKENDACNSVCIEDGTPEKFVFGDRVIKLDATLVIE